jgi:hypothetical protein
LVETEKSADVRVAVLAVAAADSRDEARLRADAVDAALRAWLGVALAFVYAYDLAYLLNRM